MKKGEVRLVELPDSEGHEQTGTRPVIVMSDTETPVSIIIPMTSNMQALRFPNTVTVHKNQTNNLKSDSVALVFQIRAIDDDKIKRKVGEAERELMARIDDMVGEMLQV